MKNKLYNNGKSSINNESIPILRVRNLKKHFISGRGKNRLVVRAVDGVSFDIYKGEVFGLVGESGCGKTTLGRTIIKLNEPTDGSIEFLGNTIGEGTASNIEAIRLAKQNIRIETNPERRLELKKEIEFNKREIKRKNRQKHNSDYELMNKMQMIFQDPIASLDPRMTVKEIIAEGLRINGIKKESVIIEKVNEVLKVVGLVPEHANRYPHEFSGGQRQRIGIARTLVINPEFLIADEPISALDVSIQAQIINLLNDLRDELGITILFIAHDLSVVKYISDRIAVMYYGKIVELAPADELFKNPLHPYTRSLLSAVPLPDPYYEKHRRRIIYNARTAHDYSKEAPVLQEITKGHFVLANSDEIKRYRAELKP